MRIRTQFILNTLLFGIILVLMAVSAFVTQRQVDTTRKQDSIAASIAQGANDLSYLANDYLIYRESQQLSRWQSRFALFANQVAALNVDRPEQQVLTRNIQVNLHRLQDVFNSAVSAAGASPSSQETVLDPTLLQVSWSRIEIQSQGLISDASRLSQLLRQQMDHLSKRRTLLIYIMMGLFGAFLLASYMLTYQRILKSLAKVQAGAASIGSGNFDFKFADEKNDEIGDLSRAFNQMTTDLKTVTASKADLEREIAERERAEQALRESEERLHFALETSHTGAWDIDLGDHSAFRSLEHDRIFGYTELLPQWTYEMFLDHVLPEDRAAVDASFQHATATQSDWNFECRIRRTDGRIRWIWASGRHRREAGDVVRRMGGIVQDITERKQAEEALRKAHDELEKRVQDRTSELWETVERLRIEIIQRKQLEATLRESENQVRFFASQCLTAQETERKRIAGELHDSIAASLAATKFGIEKASAESKQGRTDPESLQNLATNLTGIMGEVRRIMADLRPSILDDLGILAAVNWFCREYEKTYSHISVEKHIGIEEQEVPDALKTPIFRISQEAMANVSKHSQASLIRLSLQKEEARILLTVQDNGRGFKPQTVRKGLGLSSIRERAHLSGGDCIIESVEGAGTTVRCSWPI